MSDNFSLPPLDEEKGDFSSQSYLALKHRKYNRVLAGILCGLVSVTAILLGLVVGFKERIPEFYDPQNSFDGRSVFFDVSLISADPIAGTVAIMWTVLGDTCILNQTDTSNCTAVNIFFDQNLLQSSGNSGASVNDPASPIFNWDPSVYVNDVHSSAAVFRTSLIMFPIGHRSSLQQYPFDQYSIGINMFGTDAQANATVGLIKEFSDGTVAGLRLSVETFNNNSGSIFEQIKIKRGGLVIAYTLLLVVVVWIITLVFVWSTIALLCGYKQPIELLMIPVATLFTITSLRGTMPGAPSGFGAVIDYVGLLPCLALMSFCAATTLAHVVFSNAEKSRYTWLDSLSYKLFDRGER